MYARRRLHECLLRFELKEPSVFSLACNRGTEYTVLHWQFDIRKPEALDQSCPEGRVAVGRAGCRRPRLLLFHEGGEWLKVVADFREDRNCLGAQPGRVVAQLGQ